MQRQWAALAGLLVAAGCGSPKGSEAVELAEARARPKVVEISVASGFDGPPKRIYIRGFKQEKELEVWGAAGDDGPLKLMATYAIARMSGGLGPKRREGDGQVPEGLYVINRFNPNSNYHLSLGLDYPNASDRVRSDTKSPGSDIFIHGSDVSIGCLAMTDPVIEQIWVFATSARDAGQTSIPVHIFPARMTAENLRALETKHARADWHSLWRELKPFYDDFERERQVPTHAVGEDGSYRRAKG